MLDAGCCTENRKLQTENICQAGAASVPRMLPLLSPFGKGGWGISCRCSSPLLAHARQFKRLDTLSATGAVRRRGGSPRFPIANRSTKKAASRRFYDKRN